MWKIVATTILFFIIQCSASVKSYTTVHEWSTVFSRDTIANPFAVKLSDNSVVFAPVAQNSTGNSVKIDIVLKKYSFSGQLQATCHVDPDFEIGQDVFTRKLISHLEVHEYNGTNVVVSYVEDFIDHRKSNLQIHVIDFTNCTARVHAIDIKPLIVTDNFDYDKYLGTRIYSIVTRDDEIDLFLWSPSYCSKDFCKLTLNKHMEPRRMLFDTEVFENLPEFWEIITINTDSPDDYYYYISRNESESNEKLWITKLNSGGTVLKSIGTNLSFHEEISFSRAHDNLGFCSLADSDEGNLNCILVDSSLNVRMTVHARSSISALLVKNTKDNGLILAKITNGGKVIHVEKISADGHFNGEHDFYQFDAEKYSLDTDDSWDNHSLLSRFMGFTEEKEDLHCIVMQYWIAYTRRSRYEVPLIFKCIEAL